MTDALDMARLVLELLQDDMRIPHPALGDSESADIYVKDEIGVTRFLIQVTALTDTRATSITHVNR